MQIQKFFPIDDRLAAAAEAAEKVVHPTLPESRITLPIMVPKSWLLSRKAVSANPASMAQLVMAMAIRAERFWIKS